MEKILTLWYGSGLYNLTLGQAVMLVVGLLLLWLAISKKFEPLLLVPIGFGGILANIPEAGLALSAAEQARERKAAAAQARPLGVGTVGDGSGEVEVLEHGDEPVGVLVVATLQERHDLVVVGDLQAGAVEVEDLVQRWPALRRLGLWRWLRSGRRFLEGT